MPFVTDPQTGQSKLRLSEEVANAEVETLRKNLAPVYRQLELSDAQVRIFAQAQRDQREAENNAQQQAVKLHIDPVAVSQSIQKAWDEFRDTQLSARQRTQLHSMRMSTIQQAPGEHQATHPVTDSSTTIDLGFGHYTAAEIWFGLKVGVSILLACIAMKFAWRFFLNRLAEISDAVRGKRRPP